MNITYLLCSQYIITVILCARRPELKEDVCQKQINVGRQ